MTKQTGLDFTPPPLEADYPWAMSDEPPEGKCRERCARCEKWFRPLAINVVKCWRILAGESYVCPDCFELATVESRQWYSGAVKRFLAR